MFRLARLDLSGFKSFVEPVHLDFGGGMTGIVGPNGCGKSNLADAMVWVMGERSAKILRGEKMEDVIFGGSAKRQPLGMAEVYLTLARPGGEEGNGRVTIGRRLFRSGESHYFLDGKRGRLKDVRDLLMDTGLGVRAYSVIEQGRIGTILSGKPQERRRLLEEAAGITHYRERRRLAELKLEEARANLERLHDIVAEVERALRSLKRQANAARRYARRKERYRELRRQVLDARWAVLETRRSELAARIATEAADEAEVTARLHREEAELAAGREELERQNRALSELHRRNAELAARIEGKQEFLKGSRQRLEEITERVAAGRQADTMRRQRLAELASRRESLVARDKELEEDRRQALSEVSEEERRITEVERRVTEEAQRLESLRAGLLTSIADLNGLTNHLHREQMDLEKGELKRRKVDEDLATARDELAEETEKVRRAAEALAELDTEAAEGERALAALEEELARIGADERRLAELRDGIERELAGRRRRLELLTELDRAHRERRGHVAEAFVAAGLPEPEFLGDRLRSPEGWEASLDLYFGGLGDAVLVPVGADALTAARTLAGGDLAAHLVGRRPEAVPPAAPDDPAIRSSLADAVGLELELAAALPPAFLVDSPADAARLAPLHPGVAFLARDRIWAQAGVLHVQGAAARPGVFARGQELEEVRQAIPPLETRLDATETKIAGVVAAAASTREGIERAEEGLATVRERLAVARARHEDLEARRLRLTHQTETLETEAEELSREIDRVGRRAERREADLARAKELHTRLEADFDGAQQRIEAARGERETARTSGASRRGRLELAEERLDSHRAEMARAEREIEEAALQLAAWAEEAESLERRRTEIRTAMRDAEENLQEALEQRDATLGEVRGEQQTLEVQRTRLKESETVLEGRRAERDAVRDRLADLRVEEASLGQDAEHLASAYREEFDKEPPEQPQIGETEIEELEAEMERRRAQLERLGPVNLLAAREFEEQQERHTFLVEQRTDVERSVARLRETIRDINRTSTERFATTFAEVNTHFTATFQELFEGGTAEMRLLDEDDLLESGIEIVARPPGKRLQNILLLSGGEKALAAIALLFALFKTKPSPFCILDEVDAPLDDLNTLRFVRLLEAMAKETQFIVITHNKITMEAVSTLYGVTMQERGVSSLVAVELDKVQPQAEPAAVAAGA